MEQEHKFTVRCRGIILDQGELLVATHGTHDYYALPGGKLMGIDVLDHIIITKLSFLSFKQKGLL